jgi:naringenin degradation protein FdeJ
VLDVPPEAEQLMCEIALVNFVRLGKLDAIAMRLPGIVARPKSGVGFKSAFMSAMFTWRKNR